MLVVNRLDLLRIFFLAAGISAEIQNMHDVSCPLSFNPGIGNEPAGSLFSKPT
jgi:hypothetical protein